MQLATVPNHESAAAASGIARRGSKMGTGGTIGLTSQIRAKINKALKAEHEDEWKQWAWIEGDVSRAMVSWLVTCDGF